LGVVFSGWFFYIYFYLQTHLKGVIKMSTKNAKQHTSAVSSDYGKLKMKGLKRGRPRLSDKEREERKAVTAKRQEARRRAIIVLQHRHAEEYEQIFKKELKALD